MSNVKDNLSEAGGHLKQAASHAGDSIKGAAAAAGDELRLGKANMKAELADGAVAGINAAEQMGAAAKEQMDVLMEKGRDMVDSTSELIRERPLTAFGIAFAAAMSSSKPPPPAASETWPASAPVSTNPRRSSPSASGVTATASAPSSSPDTPTTKGAPPWAT